MRTCALTITAALLAASVSLAQTPNPSACFNRDLERLDHYITPPEGGDNAFFTGISNASDNTNVTLAVDVKGTMNHFTQRLYKIRTLPLAGVYPTVSGCDNQYLNNLSYFMPSNVTRPAGATSLQGLYSASKTYPDPGGYSGGYDFSDQLVTQVSGNPAAYRFGEWPTGPQQTNGTPHNFNDACTQLGIPLDKINSCTSCLQTHGYYLSPIAADNDTSGAAGVFSTNWLRFHPVKWVLMTLAYKRLVNGPLLSQLRDAVVVSNGANGGLLTQKMLPQDCHGQGRPQNQKASAIDNVSYQGTNDPLAEMLFNVAWYMGGQQTSWIFSSPSYTGTAVSGNKSGPCTSCAGAGDFIVLFADGRGDTANPKCTKADGSKSPWCQYQQACNTLGMGVGDGDDYINPNTIPDVSTAITGPSVRNSWGVNCTYDFADDVANYISTHSVTNGNPNEKIHTYVVAIGDPANTEGEMGPLMAVASAGGGQYLVADDFRTLETNIEKVFKTIISSATSFSSAAITTVQSQGYTSAYIPRFTPLPGPQWNGTLARLDFFNEFASGCTPADYGTIGDTSKSDAGTNPNKNNSCYDVYLTDGTGNFVAEKNGQFVQLDNTAAWDGGWPAKTSADGGTIAAVPYWEASDVLTTRENALISGNTTLPDGGVITERKILTVQPNGDGTYSDAGMLDFTVANVSQITPLLQLGGVNGQFCTTLASRTRHTYATEDDCATDVINFVRGQDVLMQNPYNRVIATDGGYVAGTPSPQHARPYILGDIFHSSPVLVTPPIPTFLCDLGIATQCVPSLYDPSLEAGGKDAYAGDGGYVQAKAQRDQFIIVGANDGMIHAFNAGIYQPSTDTFSTGTGQELWAFIPPEMLPKLVRYMIGETHEILVDGTPMVRDIWVDANNDLHKDIGEYHTMAIVGDREGGRHYTALDVTDPANPVFRWSWPIPGSTWTLNEGQSWDDLGPSPAAIGPIAEAVASSTPGAITVNGVKAKERYIFATGGGFDPAYLRGRSIDFIDAWTGQEVYRFAYEGAGSPALASQLFPVAAPVSLLDTNSDGVFDTAVVGDTGGQVWTVSMLNPGTPGGDGRYTNWYTARAFIQSPSDAAAGTGSFSTRSPFFQRAVAAKLGSGQIQLYLGSGDRSQIKDPNGGTCGLANLSACMRKGCSVNVQSQVYGIGPTGGTSGTYATGTFSFSGGTSTPTFTGTYDSAPIGVACSDKDDAKVTWGITCPSDAGTYEADLTCDWGGADGGVECPVANPRPQLANVNAGTPTLVYSRFYSVRLFDPSGTRIQFSDSAGAAAYDSAALTDANLVNADTTTATDTSPGWYVRHAHSSDERTSSSALLLGGCVLWNTLLPNSNSALSCSGTIPLDTAYGYQADVSTGAISCGDPGSATYAATVRSSSRNTYVAPQPPAPVISVNRKSGQVAYGSVSLDPGSPPSASTMGTNDMVAPVQWLEVPRKVHDCRHNGTNCN